MEFHNPENCLLYCKTFSGQSHISLPCIVLKFIYFFVNLFQDKTRTFPYFLTSYLLPLTSHSSFLIPTYAITHAMAML